MVSNTFHTGLIISFYCLLSNRRKKIFMQFYCTYSQVYALPMPFFTQAIYAEIRKIASVTYPSNFDFKHRFDSKYLPN